MLDSIYDIKNTLKSPFWRKNVIILSLCTQRCLCCYGRHNFFCKSVNHKWLLILLHDSISLPDSIMINYIIRFLFCGDVRFARSCLYGGF